MRLHRAVQGSPSRGGKGGVIAGYAAVNAAKHRTLHHSVNRHAVAHRSVRLADRREAGTYGLSQFTWFARRSWLATCWLPAFDVGRSALDVRCSSGIQSSTLNVQRSMFGRPFSVGRSMFDVFVPRFTVRCSMFRRESSSFPPLHPLRAPSSGRRAVGHPFIGISPRPQ